MHYLNDYYHEQETVADSDANLFDFLVFVFAQQVQTLIEDVQKLQSTLNQLRESSARQLSHFEEELQVRGRHIQRLEAQLEAQKDYQEIRRELR